MSELHDSTIKFGHLLNLNRFNNQMFFLRGFGHTFNNSINSIQLGSKLLGHYIQDIQELIDGLDDEIGPPHITHQIECSALLNTMSQVVEGISDSTLRLDQFVSHLAEFTGHNAKAGIGGGGVDFNRLVELCTSMIQQQTVNYTNNFQLELNDAPVVNSDCAGQITQVVINVMINALFALPDKSCGIVVSTSSDLEANRALLVVRDEGIGISEPALPRIIEPFYTTWHEHGCTGIGLTVSDWIVRNHGGDLTICSEQNRGTTVRVSLPLGTSVNPESHYAC